MRISSVWEDADFGLKTFGKNWGQATPPILAAVPGQVRRIEQLKRLDAIRVVLRPTNLAFSFHFFISSALYGRSAVWLSWL
jgi:hypothetical protein